MKTILRDAQKHFQQLRHLLGSSSTRDQHYFTDLSIATEEAYVFMNAGMCANTSVCRECAEHRDFIRSMLDILGELEVNTAHARNYTEHFVRYSERVNTILKNIASALAS